MTLSKCSAVVVGSGPAGVAVVGNLLEKQLSGKIVWIDPAFQAGRVHRKYREVPSNTKVGLFQQYSKALRPFRSVVDTTPVPNAFSKLAKLDQEKPCPLYHAADMLRDLTDGLVMLDQVRGFRGSVVAANLSENNWTVRIKRQDSSDITEIATSRLILCTGSSPTLTPIPVPGLDIQRLDLDTVLKPSELATRLPQDSHPYNSAHPHTFTIAVIGASHSAILALLNLVELARTSHPQLRIKWFTRHPLRYAEYKDGWILRDNTGLKGLAADFARQQLEDDKLPKSEAGRFITKIDCSGGKDVEQSRYDVHLPSCSYIVQAVGFTRNPLPELSSSAAKAAANTNGKVNSKNTTTTTIKLTPQFNPETGGFIDNRTGCVIRGLYGAGIAFPERVVDPYGNVEYAVGFWKFMCFVRRVCSFWVATTSTTT